MQSLVSRCLLSGGDSVSIVPVVRLFASLPYRQKIHLYPSGFSPPLQLQVCRRQLGSKDEALRILKGELDSSQHHSQGLEQELVQLVRPVLVRNPQLYLALFLGFSYTFWSEREHRYMQSLRMNPYLGLALSPEFYVRGKSLVTRLT